MTTKAHLQDQIDALENRVDELESDTTTLFDNAVTVDEFQYTQADMAELFDRVTDLEQALKLQRKKGKKT